MMTETTQKAPWHLWAVGIISLLWNAMGALDYSMTQTRNATYLAAVTPEQLAYIDGFPAWAVAFWALGVWGAFAGSVLLLFRNHWASRSFATGLIGFIGTSFYQATTVMPDSMNSLGALLFAAAIGIVTFGLLSYALAMRRQGVLR